MNNFSYILKLSKSDKESPKQLSRQCLSELLKAPIDQLEIVDHHHMKNLPSFLVSLSHTTGAAIAIIAHRAQYESIGIDIENKEREIKTGVEKFFINTSDSYQCPLKLWCQKEAAYKAISPLIIRKEINFFMKRNLLLTDIICKNDEFYLLKDPLVKGSFLEAKHETYQITLAFI